MDEQPSRVPENGRYVFLSLIFTLMISGILISPAMAELGYTQKWISSPAWVQEKGHVLSFEPKLFRGAELEINLSQFTTSYVNTGKDYLIAGSFNDAKTTFDTALGRDPELFDAWLGRGYALEALKRYQSAVESYETAIKFSNNNKHSYLAYGGKGRSSLENRNYPGAALAFEQAIRAYEGNPEYNLTEMSNLYEGLADARKNLGQMAEMNEAQKKAEEIRFQNTT